MTTYYYELKSPLDGAKLIRDRDGFSVLVLFSDNKKCGTLKFENDESLMEFIHVIMEDYPTAVSFFDGKNRKNKFLREPLSDILISERGEFIPVESFNS